jgi:hypothetical protein
VFGLHFSFSFESKSRSIIHEKFDAENQEKLLLKSKFTLHSVFELSQKYSSKINQESIK